MPFFNSWVMGIWWNISWKEQKPFLVVVVGVGVWRLIVDYYAPMKMKKWRVFYWEPLRCCLLLLCSLPILSPYYHHLLHPLLLPISKSFPAEKEALVIGQRRERESWPKRTLWWWCCGVWGYLIGQEGNISSVAAGLLNKAAIQSHHINTIF